MNEEVRIAVRDHTLTEVWINTRGRISGWHYKTFPTFNEAFGFLYSWSKGFESPDHWELRDPPDVAEIHRLNLELAAILYKGY